MILGEMLARVVIACKLFTGTPTLQKTGHEPLKGYGRFAGKLACRSCIGHLGLIWEVCKVDTVCMQRMS